MAGFTNRGKYFMLDVFYRGATRVTNYFAALATNAVPPTADTDTFSELTEIAAGNGYTAGGISLTPNGTDFDVLTEDDVNDRALVQIRDLVWTASGGPLPASGGGARWLVLTDDNVTQGSRRIVNYWDLASDRSVSDTQALTIQNAEVRANES